MNQGIVLNASICICRLMVLTSVQANGCLWVQAYHVIKMNERTTTSLDTSEHHNSLQIYLSLVWDDCTLQTNFDHFITIRALVYTKEAVLGLLLWESPLASEREMFFFLFLSGYTNPGWRERQQLVVAS